MIVSAKMKVTVMVMVSDGEVHNFDPMPKEELTFAASNASQCTQLIDPIATKKVKRAQSNAMAVRSRKVIDKGLAQGGLCRLLWNACYCKCAEAASELQLMDQCSGIIRCVSLLFS